MTLKNLFRLLVRVEIADISDTGAHRAGNNNRLWSVATFKSLEVTHYSHASPSDWNHASQQTLLVSAGRCLSSTGKLGLPLKWDPTHFLVEHETWANQQLSKVYWLAALLLMIFKLDPSIAKQINGVLGIHFTSAEDQREQKPNTNKAKHMRYGNEKSQPFHHTIIIVQPMHDAIHAHSGGFTNWEVKLFLYWSQDIFMSAILTSVRPYFPKFFFWMDYAVYMARRNCVV